VSKAFAARAVNLASRDLLEGDMSSGRALLREALRISPRIACTPGFWKAAASSLAGKDAVRMYQKLKALMRAA
jgi:hypothetical protein